MSRTLYDYCPNRSIKLKNLHILLTALSFHAKEWGSPTFVGFETKIHMHYLGQMLSIYSSVLDSYVQFGNSYKKIKVGRTNASVHHLFTISKQHD